MVGQAIGTRRVDPASVALLRDYLDAIGRRSLDNLKSFAEETFGDK